MTAATVAGPGVAAREHGGEHQAPLHVVPHRPRRIDHRRQVRRAEVRLPQQGDEDEAALRRVAHPLRRADDLRVQAGIARARRVHQPDAPVAVAHAGHGRERRQARHRRVVRRARIHRGRHAVVRVVRPGRGSIRPLPHVDTSDEGGCGAIRRPRRGGGGRGRLQRGQGDDGRGGGGHDGQPGGPSDGTARGGGVQDGEQAALELAAARHRQRGGRAGRRAERPDDGQQVARVVRRRRADLQHRVVAGVLALLPKPARGHPDERVEPEERDGRVGDPLRGRVPAADVRQLVRQDHAPPLGVPPVRLAGKEDDGAEDAPRHRHGGAGLAEQADDAPQPQPPREPVRQVHPLVVHQLRRPPLHPADAQDAESQAQRVQPGGRRGGVVRGMERTLRTRADEGGRRRGGRAEDGRGGENVPRGDDGAREREERERGQGGEPDQVPGRRGGAPHQRRRGERGAEDQRAAQRGVQDREERGRIDETCHSPPSSRRRASSMSFASRSSSAAEGCDSSISALTTCSGLPLKKVRTRCLSAEVRASVRGVTGR